MLIQKRYNEIRKKINFITFYNWLKSQKRKLYDTWQAIGSGSGFDLVINNKEDFNKFFCSELVAASLEKAGGIPETNCSEITPTELCSWNIYDNNYYQLTGEFKEIKRFNNAYDYIVNVLICQERRLNYELHII